MLRYLKSSWTAAGIVVVVLTLWMLSGLMGSQADKADEPLSESDNVPMLVEVTLTNPSMMSRTIELRGQLDPIRQLHIKAQTSGSVDNVIARKGLRVDAGETLISLDQEGRGNALAEARAAVKSARSEREAAQTLQRQRLQSQLQLEQSEAALEAALARMASVELDIDYTLIKAPFAGVVNNVSVELGTLVERGDVIAHIVDDSAFKVSARVAQRALSQLSVDAPVTVTLISGQTLQGTLDWIGAIADPQTRTFAVEASVKGQDGTAAAGLSAALSIPVEQVQATFISPSTLSLDEDGSLGVKALNDQDQVVFLPIALVSTTLDGAWVSGIPAQTRVITLGQGFVNTGEPVRAQIAGAI